MSKISFENSNMSASAEASKLIRRLAEPAPAGAHVETLIRKVARQIGFSFGRARSIWYETARRIDSEEMDTLRAADAARDVARGEAEDETRRKYREIVERVERLERRLAETSQNLAGE